MADKEKVIAHFRDALLSDRKGNAWRFVRTEIIEDAIELLEERETTIPKMGWITVDNALPPSYERVLVYSRQTNAMEVASFSESGRWLADDGGFAHYITHWMPLPERPESVRQEGNTECITTKNE